ncbi:accessory Sec system protein translocase subunit SecY2, partial [Streptococcus sp. IMAU11618]
MMKQSGVRKRLFWTILFVFVYVLGSKITLPFVDLAKVLNVNEGAARGLELTSAIMG